MKAWVVIPTYNEATNIERLLEALNALKLPDLTILIVDDNSPDGTADIVRQAQKRFSNVQLTVRQKKSGLGQAYIHGFTYAMQHGAERIVQMDADFSHDPNDVPRLLAGLEEHDMVIGSRYSQGISVINWPLRRLLLSTAANTYARKITGLPFYDVTGGFRAWRASALSAININDITAEGYGFQIVLSHRAWRRNLKILEIPIIFTERREGQSKMSKSIIWEAMWLVWRLKLFSR